MPLLRGRKLANLAEAKAIDRDEADGDDDHQHGAHRHGLTVVQRAGLAEVAEDGVRQCGQIGAGDHGRSAEFAQRDGKGKCAADEQGAPQNGQIDLAPHV